MHQRLACATRSGSLSPTQRHVADTPTVLTVFGTRPEVIKLAPVLRALARDARLRPVQVSTGQQADLTPVFTRGLGVEVHDDLDVMVAGQPLARLLAAVVAGLEPVLRRHAPAAVLVQGDTVSALGGALAAALQQVPVVHVEAGLRTGDPHRPFPEEHCRRLVAPLAALHCAPTEGNRAALIAEGIDTRRIEVTGNPVVDAVQSLARAAAPSPETVAALDWVAESRLVLVTAHRRENFGARLRGYLEVLRTFAQAHPEVRLVVPVHPNPEAGTPIREALGDVASVRLLPPLDYPSFVALLARAWLVVSDSGGLHEEAATLGRPLVVMREVTERPEALASGTARLAPTPADLARVLADTAADDAWCRAAASASNPFGDGRSGARIAQAVARLVLDGPGEGTA